MKKIDEFIENHYAYSDYKLESFIENFYGNEDDNQRLKDAYKKILINESVTPNKINRVVLIGEMRFASLRKSVKKLDYADPTKLAYEIKDDKIKVDDGEYKFSLSPKDIDNTIVIVRSGYKNPTVRFLIDEMIAMGFLVFNDPSAVNISNNKYLLAMLLKKHGLPQPKFVLVTKADIHKEDDDLLQDKLSKIYKDIDDDTKFVCKILGGHGGKGVFVCRKSNITSILQALFAISEDCEILIQEFCDIKDGDIRAHVLTIGNKQEILSVTMRNKGDKDFRTNLSLGNTQTDGIELTDEQKEIVLNTAKASGLAWCGVDLLPLTNGKNVVIEYNGSPGPPSELTTDQETLEKSNIEFYSSLLETINKMLK